MQHRVGLHGQRAGQPILKDQGREGAGTKAEAGARRIIGSETQADPERDRTGQHPASDQGEEAAQRPGRRRNPTHEKIRRSVHAKAPGLPHARIQELKIIVSLYNTKFAH